MQQAAKATSMPHASAATYLPKLIGAGLLERIAGTGISGVPSQYRRQGSSATSPVQPVEAAQEPADRQITLPAVDQVDDQENNGAPASDLAATIAEKRPSGKARLLEFLEAHPERGWTSAQLEIEADLSHGAVYKHMHDFVAAGLAHIVPGTSLTEYRAGAQSATTTTVLTTIPEKLTFDEREAYDALRREPEGLTERLLTHRLNWTGSRAARALNALINHGHIGRNGDKLRVIPPELQGEQDGAA